LAVSAGVSSLAADRPAPGKLVFSHIGIYTAQKKPGMLPVKGSHVWVTDFRKDPCRVEWLWIESDRPAAKLPPPHVAYRVAKIEDAQQGLKPQGKPFCPGLFDLDRVAFYMSGDGVNVELMEFSAAGSADLVSGDAAQWVYSHVGLITTDKKPAESFVPSSRVWVTEFTKHPYHVEWLRYEPDSKVTGPVRTDPHVAYVVPSIPAAAKGMKVLLEPFNPGVFGIARVGFFQNAQDAVVEFIELAQAAGK
jgi:hypothetical protein